MIDILSVLLISLMAGILIKGLHGEVRGKSKVSVMYGYPSGSRTFLTIYHCRKKNTWEFEWDDLFDSGRPKSLYPLNLCYMYPDFESGATSDEHDRAMKLLKSR